MLGERGNVAAHSILRSNFKFVALFASTLLLTASASALAEGRSLYIYMAPNGNDTFDGRSAKQPIASLGRAQEMVRENGKGYGEVRVLFAAGVYRGQAVEWRTFPGIWTRFMPSKPGAPVVFDGRGGKHSVFFKALPGVPTSASDPISMKLDFTGIKIQNYCEAISFQSWANDIRRPGGRDVVVSNSVFERIGSKYDPVRQGGLPRGNCTATIRLQGVGHSRISGNKFINIINGFSNETGLKKYGRGHLHAIYISNMSQDNLVSGNKFDNFSGDPVRIRDQSDRVKVVGNIFGSASKNTKSGDVHAISQWYCNEAVSACKQKAAKRKECTSSDLIIENNRIEGHNVEGYADRAEARTLCGSV